MNEWDSILVVFAKELGEIDWLSTLAAASDDPHVIASAGTPTFLDHQFWSQRTHEIESRALKTLTDANIDRIFEDVTAVMDDNADRFNPILKYFGRFYPAPDDASRRMDHETEMAYAVKRDLAWIGVERVIGQPGFFSSLLEWYRLGRWPCGWLGDYPNGHVLCL